MNTKSTKVCPECYAHNYPNCTLPHHYTTSPNSLILVLFCTDDRDIQLIARNQNQQKITIRSPFIPRDIAISNVLHTRNNSDDENTTTIHVLAICGVGGILLYKIVSTISSATISNISNKSSSSTSVFNSAPILFASLVPSTSICKVTFSHNSGLLGSTSTGGSIAVWDVNINMDMDMDMDIETNSDAEVMIHMEPTWESSYQCSQVTALSFSPSDRWLAAACLGLPTMGELIVIENHTNNWTHARIIQMVPQNNTSKATMQSLETTKAIIHCGMSLLTWLETNNKSNKKPSQNSIKAIKEILIGIHGPTQRWTVVDPATGMSYRKNISMLEKEHRSLVYQDVVSSLSVGMDKGLFSVNSSGQIKKLNM